jgi:branched-chain amino acid transport system permease protein
LAPFGRRNVLLALLAVAVVVPLVANVYYLFVMNLIVIYVILAIGLNILVGYAGQLAFANAAMFGIGAYGTGLMQVHLGWPFWLAFPVGALISCLVGLAISLPALRMSGLYLALSTLAFAQFAQWVFLHWESVTFGAGGFKTPALSFAPLPVAKPAGVYYLSLALAVLLFVFARNVVCSRIGRAFVAVRDGEVAAQSLGIDLLRYKALAFALSGLYAGIGGGLYSALLNFVAPEGFDLFQMILQKSMIVVGGLGSVAGAVLGAAMVVVLLEALREVKGAQELVFGALLVMFVLFLRGGLVSMIKRHVRGWEEPLRAQ